MIERKFVKENVKEFQIQEYITQTLKNVGHSHTKLQKTPLGEKITVFAAKPGLVVGKKGENIKKLTQTLKRKFELENPQIEISEVENVMLDAQIVAEKIAAGLERFGSQKFKAIGHKTLQEVMNAGALGIEIIVSGKVPSARAKSWRFHEGYLKKCGDLAITGVRKANASAQLKSGTIGIKVKIMPPNLKLPDDIEVVKTISSSDASHSEIVKDEKKEQPKNTEEPEKKKRKPRKKKDKTGENFSSSEQSSSLGKVSETNNNTEVRKVSE